MGPFGVPNEVPQKVAREIVAEFSREILEKTAFVLGPASEQAKTLREAQKLEWKCRVYKLRNNSFLVVPINKVLEVGSS